MSRHSIGEYLYNKKLPGVYKREDANFLNPYPLKRFLKLLDFGFEAMWDSIQAQEDLYDVDNCPVEFLSLIVETMGFVFPYALDEKEQRKFTKMLPKLYKAKGTPKAFEYLAREIFGTESTVRAYKETYVPGMTPREWRRIYVEVTLDGEQYNLGRKEEYFKKFCELVRPVNTLLITFLVTYIYDHYDRNRLGDGDDLCYIEEDNKKDSYRTISIRGRRLLDIDFYLDTIEPMLDFSEADIEDTIKDELVEEGIVCNDTDDYTKQIQDSHEDFISYTDADRYSKDIYCTSIDSVEDLYEEVRPNNLAYEVQTTITKSYDSILDSKVVLDGKFYMDDIQKAMTVAY